uniref:Band 7 domain-containing protein n=1 Tax=Hemiselmis tepida TaxID=464990 RepID=A0A7S0YMM6_9CRYP|mmetsp:Transcript_15379/g.39148  ORF Transcript_15379/g.39148 Transcript_15379/m.39148 type:complete len:282 (+) Transcript_15379:101-946(+)
MPCCVCVDASQRAVVQRFGQYAYTAGPGLNCILFPIYTAANVSIKVRQIDVRTETKTKDNVTLRVTAAIQFSVNPDEVDKYFFKLHDPERQITAHVEDSVRSFLPTLDLDHAFESKEKMANEIKDSVSKSMAPYGVIVNKALVVDMQPDASVLAAMNQINAARRNREAALEKAEAEKIMAVRSAEADAEAKHLSGVGTARMRQAITEGFKGSITAMRESCGLEPKEVVHMMLVTQYLDVLKEFAASGKATMVVPHGPSAVQDIEGQVRNGFLQANLANQMS